MLARRFRSVIALLSVVPSGCGGPPASDCPECRTLDDFGETNCHVEIRGYYYVAAPLSFTGAWPVGGEVERGIVQAFEEINAAGGVQGRPLGLVSCETESDPTRAQAIMRELASHPEISATTCCLRSAEVLSTWEVAVSEGIVMLSPGATSTRITDLADDGWVNRTVPPDSIQGAVGAAVAFEGGARSVFVATLNDPYGVTLAQVFMDAFAALGGTTSQVTYTESGDSYSPPLSDVIAGAMGAAPDLMYVAGLSRDAATLVNVASDRTYVVPWLLPDGGRSSDFLAAVTNRDYLSNIRGTAPAPPSGPFVERFRTQWGMDPQVFVASAYDAAYLLATAMQLASDPENRVEVRDHLLQRTQTGTRVAVEDVGWEGILRELEANGQVDYDGASGPVDLDGFGDVAANVELWDVDGGAFRTIGCRTPENTDC